MTFLEHFSWKQQAIIATIPKISSFFSIGGSLRLLCTISKKRQQNESENSSITERRQSHNDSNHSSNNNLGVSMKERLLVGISVADILASIGYFWGTWAFPEETEVWGAIGNSTTCNISGVLRGVGLLIYPQAMAMGLYYYIAVKKGLQGIQRLQRYEKHIHGSVIFFGIALTVTCLWFDVYQAKTYVCFASFDPNNCDPDDTQCFRQRTGSRLPYVILFQIPIIASFFGSLCFMPMIYCYVRKTERAMYRYAAKSSRDHVLRAVAIQGFLYTGALLMCTIPPLLSNLVVYFSNPPRPNFTVTLISAFSEPFQGFLNMVVYHRTITTDSVRNIQSGAFSCEEMELIETMEHELKEGVNVAFNVAEHSGSSHLRDNDTISRHLSLEAINIQKKNTLRLHSDMFPSSPAWGETNSKTLETQDDTSSDAIIEAQMEEDEENTHENVKQEFPSVNLETTPASFNSQPDVERPTGEDHVSPAGDSSDTHTSDTSNSQALPEELKAEDNTRPIFHAVSNDFEVSEDIRSVKSNEISVAMTNKDIADDSPCNPYDVGSIPV